MEQEQLFKLGLFHIIEELHMSKTGGSEPLSPEQEKEYLHYLNYRLTIWKDLPNACTEEYDSCVKRLIETVIWEYE